MNYLPIEGWSFLFAVKGAPRGQGVHVISPMDDFSAFDGDDRAKPIVVLHTGRKDSPVNFVLDDDRTAVIGLVDNQMVRRLEFDVTSISAKLTHKVGASLDLSRPSQVIEDFVDDVVSDNIEEVLAINEVAQRASD